MQPEIINTIIQKVPMLTEKQQRILLEEIETFLSGKNGDLEHTEKNQIHPLTFLSEIAVDMGVDDLAENHDFYAHRKVED